MQLTNAIKRAAIQYDMRKFNLGWVWIKNWRRGRVTTKSI